ncbi:hypothetical protein HYZ06_01210 [Candidatus Daviesbacteria bacterium]|nr:hypothetical protein [Candidatus Daviesbacteria bacterium]
MNAEDLTLNIAVNLGRISRFAMEKRKERVKQFLQETENYLDKLEKTPKSDRFESTFANFKRKFESLKNNIELNKIWAEDILTWANILQHRAKLA